MFNLGGGPANSVSLRELIALLSELTGREIACSFSDWRPGDQPWFVTDTRALHTALGWQPKTSLQNGLLSLHKWLTSRFVAVSNREALA